MFVKHIVVTSQRLPEPYVLEFVEPILRPTFGKQFVLYEKNQNKDSSRKLIPPPFRPPFRPRFPCPFSVFYSISSPFLTFYSKRYEASVRQRVFSQIKRVETRSRLGFEIVKEDRLEK